MVGGQVFISLDCSAHCRKFSRFTSGHLHTSTLPFFAHPVILTTQNALPLLKRLLGRAVKPDAEPPSALSVRK